MSRTCRSFSRLGKVSHMPHLTTPSHHVINTRLHTFKCTQIQMSHNKGLPIPTLRVCKKDTLLLEDRCIDAEYMDLVCGRLVYESMYLPDDSADSLEASTDFYHSHLKILYNYMDLPCLMRTVVTEVKTLQKPEDNQ